MYNVLKDLIERKFYADGEEARVKAAMLSLCDQLTEEQYVKLSNLIDEVYEINSEE